MKKVFFLLLSLCILLCSCVSGSPDLPQKTENEKEDPTQFIKAVWLSYTDLSELLENADEQVFTGRIEELIKSCNEYGFNTLIVHAVPFCDAFYESDILPERVGFDAFGIICSLCKNADIPVEAWINPYRVSGDGNLPSDSPVNNLGEGDVLDFDGSVYLNPASENAKRLIISYVREIIEKYDVSAVHLDDYFYPTDEAGFDKPSYESYVSSGGGLSLSDWRRANVTGLIHSLHFVTKEYGVLLSLSPAADVEKTRKKLFADVPYFIENGLIDEVIPQIYFGFENEKMPFEDCLEKWISLCENKNVRLVIGLAFYKTGREDLYAGGGKNEWLENPDVISREVRLILQKNTIYGVSFFSYSYIFGKKQEKIAKKELQILKSVL